MSDTRNLIAAEWARRSYDLIDTRRTRQLLRSRTGWHVCDHTAETFVGPMPEDAARLMFAQRSPT